MDPLISVLIITPLLIFWVWMFWDMSNNEYIPGGARYYWFLAFLFANIFAATYYYVTEYRYRH